MKWGRICPQCSCRHSAGYYEKTARGNPRGICSICRAEATPPIKPRVQAWLNAKARELNLVKQRARQKSWRARRAGLLIPQPCQVCGRTDDVEGHHPDYSKPLEVQWLCPKHHAAITGPFVAATRRLQRGRHTGLAAGFAPAKASLYIPVLSVGLGDVVQSWAQKVVNKRATKAFDKEARVGENPHSWSSLNLTTAEQVAPLTA